MSSIAYLSRTLREKEKTGTAIQVAVLGTGWFGSGVVGELVRCPGVCPKLVIGLKAEHAVDCLRKAGVPASRIVVPESMDHYRKAMMSRDVYVACASGQYHDDLRGVDVFFDATGNVVAGAEAALSAIRQKVHFITISSELDATVGWILARRAAQAGVVYSNCDGDQPGVLARMIDEVRLTGFEVVVAGNCKGFIDVHKTAEDLRAWIKPGHNPRMITAFTDGTKQALELAVTANAAGLAVDKCGMHGVTTTKDNLVADVTRVLSRVGVVEYVLGINGINQGGGVFVIGHREGARVSADMDYMKKGKGPYFLFFKDEHLCYFSAITSIASAVLLNASTSVPVGRYADVLAVAKRNLKAGEPCDGIGGFTVYGAIDNADEVARQGFLPVGLSEFARIEKNVVQDCPLTWDAVSFSDDNKILKLRKEQDQLKDERAGL